jgi:hypothetical protein
MPLPLKPAPLMLTFDSVTSELPAFVNVTLSMLLPPTFTFPNVRADALELRVPGAAALTVSVAALLVTVPNELLTATLNCGAFAELVSAGVV